MAIAITKTTLMLFQVLVMQQSLNQKFCLQKLGRYTFFSPIQGNRTLNPILHQWQTLLTKLHQKCDRGRAKRNWLEGLSANPGFHGLFFFQVVYWLEQKKILLLPRLLAFCWWFFTSLDFYPERTIGKQDHECNSTFSNIIVVPVVDVPSNAKPIIYQRLQDLAIPCWRTRDGNIWVEISNVNIAVLVHSTIKQSTVKPQATMELLQNCWNKDISH
ncbi:MAG: Asr1405/Asl0597 family protein [Waterburya sp.]